jgi:hypothetical protein
LSRTQPSGPRAKTTGFGAFEKLNCPGRGSGSFASTKFLVRLARNGRRSSAGILRVSTTTTPLQRFGWGFRRASRHTRRKGAGHLKTWRGSLNVFGSSRRNAPGNSFGKSASLSCAFHEWVGLQVVGPGHGFDNRKKCSIWLVEARLRQQASLLMAGLFVTSSQGPAVVGSIVVYSL